MLYQLLCLLHSPFEKQKEKTIIMRIRFYFFLNSQSSTLVGGQKTHWISRSRAAAISSIKQAGMGKWGNVYWLILPRSIIGCVDWNINLTLTLGREEAGLLRGCCNEKAQAWFFRWAQQERDKQQPQVPNVRLCSGAAGSRVVLTSSLPAHPLPPREPWMVYPWGAWSLRPHHECIGLGLPWLPRHPLPCVPALRMTLNTAPSQEKPGDCTQPVPEYWKVLEKIAVSGGVHWKVLPRESTGCLVWLAKNAVWRLLSSCT